MKQITVTHGKVTLVDDEDFDYLNQYKWHCNKGYVSRTGNNKHLRMHRVIMHVQGDLQVDHIDGNPLNNQKNNLRICTSSQNNKNKKTPHTNTSGFRGVSYHVSNKKWQSQIQVDGKQIHLGYFKTPEEASISYEDFAKKTFGSFLRTQADA